MPVAVMHATLARGAPVLLLPQRRNGPSGKTTTARAIATTTTTTTTPPASSELPQPPPPLVLGAVEALFRVKPLFDAATRRARATIIDRAQAIGVDWEGEKAALRAAVQSWDDEIARAVEEGTLAAAGGRAGTSRRGLSYPSYYTVPFHAYAEGNLSLDAALEVSVAAASVHATVFAPPPAPSSSAAPPPPPPDPRGDARLREGYMAACLSLLRELEAEGLLSFEVPSSDPALPSAPPQKLNVLDLGAATGLSSLALADALGPSAQVTGVDLSPHFVAVGRVEMARRRLAETLATTTTTATAASQRVALFHGAIEDTGLPSASFDVVSMCLVAHELPRSASRDAFREARRLLKPGGAFCMMDMDPFSAAFQRIYSSPFALAAFKSTEPWLTEYVSLDALAAVADAGFVGASVRAAPCSPRHRAIVAAAPREAAT